MSIVLNAELRTDKGKGASRRLRREGKVPAILYGGQREPRALVMDHDSLLHHLENEAVYSSILTVTVDDVQLVGCTRGWLRYRLPKRFIRKGQNPVCIGQKQKWFLLRLLADDSAVRLDHNHTPEFDHWRWVSYWYPLDQVISFKREVYRRALKELALPLGRHTERLADR